MTSSDDKITKRESGRDLSTLVEILFGLGVVFFTTSLAFLVANIGFNLQQEVHSSNLIMIYLMGVLVVSCYFGRAAALSCAILSVAAFDFLFVDPIYSLVPSDKEYAVVVVVMLAAALMVNELSMRARFNARKAEEAKVEAESEKMKNILLRSVSHDLKSPLSSIIGAASLLSEADEVSLDESQRAELLLSINQESARLNNIVSNILETTRLESGGIKLNRDWYLPEEIIGNALAALGSRLAGDDIELDLADNLPLVFVDSMLLEQVIVNLLDNSLKYAPDSSYKLKAWSEDGSIYFEVHNDGEAIPREKQELVFEKFYRKDGDTRGAGLGLAICKSIVGLHDGRIWVVPDVEKGVSFRIRLPAGGEQIDMPVEAPEEPA